MIGSVVSMEVAPAAAMGAKRPKKRTKTGATNSAITSLIILDKSAMVPASAPLYSVIKMLERE